MRRCLIFCVESSPLTCNSQTSPVWAVVQCYRIRTAAAGCKTEFVTLQPRQDHGLHTGSRFVSRCWLQRLADPDPHKHDLNLSQLAALSCVQRHGGYDRATQTDLSVFLCGVLFRGAFNCSDALEIHRSHHSSPSLQVPFYHHLPIKA
jgi:hypothetical protein